MQVIPSSLGKDRELNQKLRQAETRAQHAEHRAQQNETILNQKMLEMSKLQGTLTQQSKVNFEHFKSTFPIFKIKHVVKAYFLS